MLKKIQAAVLKKIKAAALKKTWATALLYAQTFFHIACMYICTVIISYIIQVSVVHIDYISCMFTVISRWFYNAYSIILLFSWFSSWSMMISLQQYTKIVLSNNNI